MQIYLAKSNRANPNLVSLVRDALITSGYQIAEYTGGTYSVSPLVNSDACVVILESHILGRGVFEQIVAAKQHKVQLIVVCPYNNKYYVMPGSSFTQDKSKGEDYVHWGRLNFSQPFISAEMSQVGIAKVISNILRALPSPSSVNNRAQEVKWGEVAKVGVEAGQAVAKGLEFLLLLKNRRS